MREHLTELEGAILSEIYHCGSDTAFKVRRAFENSPSLEWRGSAGSVYPAIKRLTAGGRIKAVPRNDGRNSLVLQLTHSGIAALQSWAADPERAISVGIDPFRLRSGIWCMMPPEDRKRTLRAVASKLLEHIESETVAFPVENQMDEVRRRLALGLQQARLAWIEMHLSDEH